MSRGHKPRFSVVVPTHNRRAQLEECLGALSSVDYPRERFEVLVVQDGGAYGLEPLTVDWSDRLNITVARQEHAGPAAARNRGAKIASGRYLAFTDDDCRPANGWLAAFDAALEESPDAGLGGTTINALENNVFSSASQLIADFLHERFHRDARFFPTNNLCVPTEEFRALGGFDSSYRRAAGEDRDFCRRWLATGRRLKPAPDALVAHAHALDTRSFWRQHYAYGQGSCRFHRPGADHPASDFEDWRFYLDLLLSPFQRSSGIEAARATALLSLAQAATAAGFLVESVMQGYRDDDSESDV